MVKKQQGFTLIELMIVIAIIGILAAVALPQYQDFIARSQVTRVVGEVSSLKSATEAELIRGKYPATAAALGYTESNISTDPTVAFAAGDKGAGTLVTTLDGDSSTAVAGAKITLTRLVDGKWSCAVDGAGAASWKDKYIPAGCTAVAAASGS